MAHRGYRSKGYIMAENAVHTSVITKSTLLPALRALIQSGVSQHRIAREFGVSPNCINHWILGKREPSAMAVKLAGYVLAQPREIGVGLPLNGGGFAGNRRDKPVYDGPKRKRGRPKLAK